MRGGVNPEHSFRLTRHDSAVTPTGVATAEVDRSRPILYRRHGPSLKVASTFSNDPTIAEMGNKLRIRLIPDTDTLTLAALLNEFIARGEQPRWNSPSRRRR